MIFLRKAVLAFVFLSIWGVALRQTAPSVAVGDSGEFITAAATLSLPHPPSYPLFSLFGKTFQISVPWGNPAYRVNLASTICLLGSLLLIFFWSRRLGFPVGGAIFAVMLAACGPAFFHNSLLTEVFSLNALMALGLWGTVFLPWPAAPLLALFILSVGLGNHHTLVLVAPGCLIGMLLRLHRGSAGRLLRPMPWASLLLLCGISVFLFLPLRSKIDPPLDWGNPETFPKVMHNFLRRDYGSLSLSIGKHPERDLTHTARQLKRFGESFVHQASPLGTAMSLFGAFIMWKRNRRLAASLLVVVFLTGPFFLWLGNPSFDAQSDGVMERFLILPVVFSVFFSAETWSVVREKSRMMAWALFLPVLWGYVETAVSFPMRSDFLPLDYSRNILRTLPPNAALFMDGGDDTYFTSAFQQFVNRQREDVHFFDRGGLIFRNPYGADFRSLPKSEKERRRLAVEGSWFGRGPVYYSTMDQYVIPGVSLLQDGFLYIANAAPGARISDRWDFYVLRNLFPPAMNDYRTRALAPYFPFLKARWLWQSSRREDSIRHMQRAWRLAPDVLWVQSNLSIQLLSFAYDRLMSQDWPAAERLSRMILAIDPSNVTAMCNLGVISEKQGMFDAAAGWYERSLSLRPGNVDALYNLAVIHWRTEAWDKVVPLLEQVVRLQPGHSDASRYLDLAKRQYARAH